MLQPQRRHTGECNKNRIKKHGRPLGRKDLKRCNCPLMVVGVDSRGKFHNRESLKTCDLAVAAKRVHDIELDKPKAPDAITIEMAYDQYVMILKSQRDVKENSISNNYDIVYRALNRLNVKNLGDITGTVLDRLVGTWSDLGVNTRHNYIRILQDFIGLAFRRKWILEDPSVNLVRPKRPAQKGTLPFDLQREDPRILEAIPNWTYGIESYGLRDRGHSIWQKHPATASALMYVLRYTGLRMSDAIMFEPQDLVKRTFSGKEAYCYFLPRQEKTDEPVFCVLPADVAEYIFKAPRLTAEHAFYDSEGSGERMEHKRQWNTRFRQNVMRYLERVSGVPNVHPHRFRDTFSIDLIAHGTDIRIVSRLLGHTDVATTLKSYEHWLPSDQDKAAEAMLSIWDSKQNVIPFKGKKRA